MRKSWEESTITDVIEEAYPEIDDLHDQMRDAYDALPEGVQYCHHRRGDAAKWLEVASDTLCGLAPRNMYDRKHQVQFMVMRPGKDGRFFRPARRDNVVRGLEACVYRLAEPQHEKVEAPGCE